MSKMPSPAYHYDLDEISHDPYVLISAITALRGGAWTVDEVGGVLQMLFDKQYILTETVEAETRYRTETETGSYPYYDDTTGQWITVEYEYTVPKSCVCIREPYSDARRKADSERAKKAGIVPPGRSAHAEIE